jgi:sortase (surface protein transpeptidase)
VSLRHGSDGHEPLRDNGHFDSNGTRGNARVVVAGHRTLRRHLCDLMALFHGASI